jgi:hypothetical protein
MKKIAAGMCVALPINASQPARAKVSPDTALPRAAWLTTIALEAGTVGLAVIAKHYFEQALRASIAVDDDLAIARAIARCLPHHDALLTQALSRALDHAHSAAHEIKIANTAIALNHRSLWKTAFDRASNRQHLNAR